MITLYGVTEDGTSVPVQVTDDGKIVAVGQQGPPGPPGQDGQDSQVPGPPGPPGEIQNGDDVEFGTITAVGENGTIEVNNAGNAGSNVLLRMRNANNSGNKSAHLFTAGGYYLVPNRLDGTGAAVLILDSGSITATGAITAADNKAGFNASGELIFFSRGQRYRAVVQNNNVMAEEYTREMELREKAENKLEELREPKSGTQDIVPED